MFIGNLYVVKEYYWLLYPARIIAAVANAPKVYAADDAKALADCWHQEYYCEVTYFSPGSHIVFLEEDGKLKRVLTADGKIGWICFHESYNDCFEEVKVAV